MPIRPHHRWLYPIDWRELSASIRFRRARGRCEGCGRPHGRTVVHLDHDSINNAPESPRGAWARLTRSLAFLSRLLEAGVDVRFCDLPQIEGPTGRFMLQQMAAVAELEAGLIGDRTRKALAAKAAWYAGLDEPARDALRRVGKAVQLGGDRGAHLSAEQRARGRAARTSQAVARTTDLAPVITELRAAGALTLVALAEGLNKYGIPASQGGAWSPTQVKRVLDRSAE